LEEARDVLEKWRIDYNTERPHSSLGDRTPLENLAQWYGLDAGIGALKEKTG
jgi:transposase InsO family protein